MSESESTPLPAASNAVPPSASPTLHAPAPSAGSYSPPPGLVDGASLPFRVMLTVACVLVGLAGVAVLIAVNQDVYDPSPYPTLFAVGAITLSVPFFTTSALIAALGKRKVRESAASQ